jgi:hypothetical protein
MTELHRNVAAGALAYEQGVCRVLLNREKRMKSFMAVYNGFCNNMIATHVGFLPIEAETETEAERIAERLRPGAWEQLAVGGTMVDSVLAEILENDDEEYGSNDPDEYPIPITYGGDAE